MKRIASCYENTPIIGPFKAWSEIPEETMLIVIPDEEVVFRPRSMNVLVSLTGTSGWSVLPSLQFRVAPKGFTITLAQE